MLLLLLLLESLELGGREPCESSSSFVLAAMSRSSGSRLVFCVPSIFIIHRQSIASYFMRIACACNGARMHAFIAPLNSRARCSFGAEDDKF